MVLTNARKKRNTKPFRNTAGKRMDRAAKMDVVASGALKAQNFFLRLSRIHERNKAAAA